MPNLTVVIPAGAVTELVAAATAARYPRVQGDTDQAYLASVAQTMLRDLVRRNRQSTRIAAAQIPNEDVGF
jgi:hypothetical protein